MRSPQVVIASCPPGRTMRHSSLTCLTMSGTKKIANTHTTVSRMLQRLVVDKWDRDKAFAETLEVLNKIYGKYA